MQIWRCPNARIGYSINSRLALRGTPISYAQFGNVAGGREGEGKGAGGVMHLSLFLRFWQCWKCCEKDMDILS